jgi:hypothetical protein
MSAIGKLLGKKCHLAKLLKLVKDSIFGINVSRWKTVGKKASPFKLTKLFQACKNIWNKCQPLEKSLGKKVPPFKAGQAFQACKRFDIWNKCQPLESHERFEKVGKSADL